MLNRRWMKAQYASAPLRLMQKLRLGWLVRLMSKLMPASLRRMQEMVPPLRRHHGKLPEVMPAEGKRRARVGLMIGCAADAFFPQGVVAPVARRPAAGWRGC